MKTFINGKKPLIIPPLLVNNDLIYNFSIIPTNQIFYTENRLRDFDADCGETLRLANRLNSHKAHGHYKISIRKFKLRNLRKLTLSV